MKILAILPYGRDSVESAQHELPEDEKKRLQNKSKEYTLESSLCRHLLFTLCDEIFFEDYEKRVGYHPHPSGEGTCGKPYLPSLPTLSISLSHTDGACAVFLSDAGECGVDIENTDKVKTKTEDTLDRIIKRMYLADFSSLNAENFDDLQIIIYKINQNTGKIEKTEEQTLGEKTEETEGKKKPVVVFDETKNDDKHTFFLSLYTRMEAIGKATGYGISFLCQREKYQGARYQTLISSSFVLSLAIL